MTTHGQPSHLQQERRRGRQVRDRPGRDRAEDQPAVAARRGGDVPGERAPGHAQHEEPQRSGRHDEEDVSPEGHGQRPRRFAACAAAARRLATSSPCDTATTRYRLPKKAMQAATRMAIVSKMKSQDVVVIDELAFNEPEDQGNGRHPQGPEARRQEHAGHHGRSRTQTSIKSARNIDKVTVLAGRRAECPGRFARRKKMLVTKAALDAIKERGGQGRQACISSARLPAALIRDSKP